MLKNKAVLDLKYLRVKRMVSCQVVKKYRFMVIPSNPFPSGQ